MSKGKRLIKTNKLCLANGDEFDKTEFVVDTDVLAGFIKVKTEGKTIYVNPELSYPLKKVTCPSYFFLPVVLV